MTEYYADPGTGVVYQLMYPMPQMAPPPFYPAEPVQHIPVPVPDNPAAITIPVSCGHVAAKMHLELFICPGIHRPCIELDGELLTPKQFTIRADKEKQKDWKGSIRIGKTTLRCHMDAKTIDFHNHANNCSGKCQSRNYLNSFEDRTDEFQLKKERKSAILRKELGELTKEFVEGTGDVEKQNEVESVNMDRNLGGEQNPEENLEDVDYKNVERSIMKKTRGRPKGSKSKKLDKSIDIDPNDSIDDDLFETSCSNYSSGPVTPGCTPYNVIMECLKNDPMQFWGQMHATGVISEFCDDIIVSAINMKQSVLTMSEISDNASNCLSRSIFALGIQSLIVQRVQAFEKHHYNQKNGEKKDEESPDKTM